MLFVKKWEQINEISEITYDKEDQMQEYIYKNPQILPIEELTWNKKLLVLIRELSTEYGRLDGFWIDESWNVYIIETKLLRNPDRRNIIAQLLDYWVALRTEYKDPQDLLNHLESKWINTKQLILDHFQTTEDLADKIIENFKENIKQWVYQFVAVTDAIERRILDQINFINQSSKFSFFLVDLRYYKHDDVEFIIPKWYWWEIVKTTKKSTTYSSASWSEAEFFDVLESNTDLETRTNVENMVKAFWDKGYIVEYWQAKYPTVRIYDDRNDNFLVNIYSASWDLVIHKNSKIDMQKRYNFYKNVFWIDFNKTEKINYTIKKDEYAKMVWKIIDALG